MIIIIMIIKHHQSSIINHQSSIINHHLSSIIYHLASTIMNHHHHHHHHVHQTSSIILILIIMIIKHHQSSTGVSDGEIGTHRKLDKPLLPGGRPVGWSSAHSAGEDSVAWVSWRQAKSFSFNNVSLCLLIVASVTNHWKASLFFSHGSTMINWIYKSTGSTSYTWISFNSMLLGTFQANGASKR